MDNSHLQSEIRALKKERNAVILAHNYQRPEVQDVADYLGDSYGLSREAAKTDADVIVFCGVDFMAETAKILNPEKTVLIPAVEALCPMAMLLTSDDIVKARKQYPGAEVVLYINTHASEKALCDCVCTSGNAVKVVNAMKSDTIIFGPDLNLAHYVRKRTGKRIVPVPEKGVCPTHHQITLKDVEQARKKHPDAKLVVHPEVPAEVQDVADHIASTEGIIEYCKKSPGKEFIIGTEKGILYRMHKEIPGKKFYPASDMAICPTMKTITLEKVLSSLKNMQNRVEVPQDTAIKARKSIERMLEIT
ncbi:MAG: quinolinate synthase NadA [Candidatus Altiarchaeota archaeon]|nr:quinolinate synthase NadA [Candidatus Altiarchaeota archaeon]